MIQFIKFNLRITLFANVWDYDASFIRLNVGIKFFIKKLNILSDFYTAECPARLEK